VLPDLPRDLYRRPGPFASAYIDVTRAHEDAVHKIELRWKDLAAELYEQGADAQTVAAIEQVVLEPTGQPGPTGLAVFASNGQVRLSATLPDMPRESIGRWAPLPHVMPLLAQAPDLVPHVVVELGKTSATVLGVDSAGQARTAADERGEEEDTHKPRGGAASHLGMQRRTEEQWKQNVRSFASTVERVVSELHAELLVVSGDVQARTLLLDELGGRSRDIAVEIDGPNPDDDTTTEGIDDEVSRLVAERAAQQSREVLDSFATARGRDTGLAATGVPEVVRALQQGQVETLVLVDDPSSTQELWVGPEPWQLANSEAELRELDAEVLGRDRADAALVRAAAGTGARLLVLPHPAAAEDPSRAGSASGARGAGPRSDELPEMSDGVGAVLRFSTPQS
jgi:hypothetical protein